MRASHRLAPTNPLCAFVTFVVEKELGALGVLDGEITQ